MATEDLMPRSVALREALEKARRGGQAPTVMLSVAEACGKLGIGRTTLYKLIRKKIIKSVKIEGRRLISMKAIERFIEAREKEEAEA
jgi:excisionase family DNA binding protein